MLRSGVWLVSNYWDMNNFFRMQGIIADLIEESYLYNSGIVMNAHPLSNTVKLAKHTNQKFSSDVAQLALVDSNYVQLTKTLANAFIEYEINHETELFYRWGNT